MTQTAFSAEQFFLEFQPIVAVADAKVESLEALARWRPYPGCIVYPDQFLPLLRRDALMAQADLWILEIACREHTARAGAESGALGINVNVSAELLAEPTFAYDILTIIERYELPHEKLKVEVTEDRLVDNCDAAFTQLQQLRDHGVRVCIDDFGTGFSSLSYLYRLPIDILKIDRSFLAQMSYYRCAAIVEAIIDLGRRLELGVVAEGVETLTQWLEIRRMGCDWAQGAFFGMPGAALKPA
jgi:EAL domain-containing protein (putative c-di-GMP-specific phosphodiesterase class I)